VIGAIRRDDAAYAEALHRRYCDFWLVDGEMELNSRPFSAAQKQAPDGVEKQANTVPVEMPRKRRAAAKKSKKPATA
jgi:hypothetical protein